MDRECRDQGWWRGGWFGLALWPVPGSGCRFEGDAIAQALEVGDGSLADPLGVSGDEVVAAKVFVGTAAGEEIPRDDQDRVADGDSRLLLADPPSETPELGDQVGVTGSCRRPGALIEEFAGAKVLAGAAMEARIVARPLDRERRAPALTFAGLRQSR